MSTLDKPMGTPNSRYRMAEMPATPVTGTPAATAKVYTPMAEIKQPSVSSRMLTHFFSVITVSPF